MSRAGALLSICLLVTSCVTIRPRTQVVVEIDAEPMISAEADAIDIVVRGGPIFEELEQAIADTRRAPVVYPIRITVVPRDDDASRVFEVAALARTEGGDVIGRLRARGRFVPGQTAYIRLTLEDCCLRIASTCAREETCSECICVPAVIVEPEIDAGILDDAGVDAGGDGQVEAGDVGTDAGPPMECTDASECHGMPCSVASCTLGVCTYALVCGAGETCCEGVCATDCTCLDIRDGTVCRDVMGPCDVAERCNGTSPTCPPDAVAPSGNECRAADGPCDQTEACDGATVACPADSFIPSGVPCTDGMCNGLGTCLSGCMAGLPCATTNPCERGETACTPARCEPAGPAPATTVCRPAAGPCDVSETCGGATTCPADGFAGGSVTCRPSAGPCDLPDTCGGVGPLCGPDLFRGPIVCRTALDACDVPESCTGTSGDCPPDRFAPATVRCGIAFGECDEADFCSGTSTECVETDTNGRPCGNCNGQCQFGECQAMCPVRTVCCTDVSGCVGFGDCF